MLTSCGASDKLLNLSESFFILSKENGGALSRTNLRKFLVLENLAKLESNTYVSIF